MEVGLDDVDRSGCTDTGRLAACHKSQAVEERSTCASAVFDEFTGLCHSGVLTNYEQILVASSQTASNR